MRIQMMTVKAHLLIVQIGRKGSNSMQKMYIKSHKICKNSKTTKQQLDDVACINRINSCRRETGGDLCKLTALGFNGLFLVKTTQDVPVYSCASGNSTRIALLPKGLVVCAKKLKRKFYNDKWLLVVCDGVSGYVLTNAVERAR
jgi:hypothetical protein